MTKTLTEQWREGTLPEGYYYTKSINILDKERIMIDYYIPMLHHFEIMPSEYVKEVIVEAPNYDEWEQAKENLDKNGTWYTERSYKLIEKKLAIATKALKEYDNKQNWDIRGVSFMKYNKGFTIARKALKEMEGVK